MEDFNPARLRRIQGIQAVNRAYHGVAEPVGGSGYLARLRLHYRDGELNGNAEGTLQLWRYPVGGPGKGSGLACSWNTRRRAVPSA